MDHIKRIIYALEKSNITRQNLADKLKLGRGAVSARLNNSESEFDSLKYLEATAELTGFRFEWLRTGMGPEKDEGQDTTPGVSEPDVKYIVNTTPSDLAQCIAEKEKLKFEIEILRSALREIGEGKKKITNGSVAPKFNHSSATT
jgi:transcriptional regulator with XRE-family HTH domain